MDKYLLVHVTQDKSIWPNERMELFGEFDSFEAAEHFRVNVYRPQYVSHPHAKDLEIICVTE